MIPILIGNSRNTEVDSVADRSISAYQSTSLNTDPNMVKIFSPLEAESALLSSAIKPIKEKSEQKTNDEFRGEKTDALYFLLMSFSHHPDPAIKKAALSLLDTFDHYGLEMKNESYSSESSLINSLLGDYVKPKAQTNIALVPQCAEYIAALQGAQTVFENTRLSFEEARAEEGTMENASALKKEVVDIINKKVVPYLNVMEQLDDATYGAFAHPSRNNCKNKEVVK
jgi:hypothetical protein